ncbi:N-acetylmuramoyl-L-alanine amidase family protein [Plebeiibacterium marinum]|uniref:N-acetylmuramoyl-L-alanine amidase n=1 Tax=Plebeiibacterium marinum TaxID=2992111 RepID=A0AAE3SMH2_9BACT|nr:N-acetylmuramoyl-L-alanine amidase [Plebeiobacterium marinum]MCW3807550.1 N-acetylmuramoyl-L-alanine amidase [Plebeiobacterium marinum]
MALIKKLTLFLLCNIFAVIALAQQDTLYNTSVPQKGEGLYAFLIRNKLDPQKHKQSFIELNKEKLGKNNALLLGVKYKIPSVDVYLYEPLYGKEREKFKLESEDLKGAVFHLVSGHGGPDPGALGKYGDKTLAEDEYAYDITLRLAKKLQENGAIVNMIIQDKDDGIRGESYLPMDKDEVCNNQVIGLEQIDRLKQRTKYINQLFIKNKPAYQRCVIIHVDSRSKGKAIDVFFYHSAKSKSGKKTAQSLLNIFDEKYSKHQPSRGYSGVISSRNLYLLRKTYPTAVFIELGNIRNFRDQQRFIIENNRQALANWLYEGLLNDYKGY